MQTSYFSIYKKNDGVSIAIKSPNYFIGNSYSDLFPKWSFLKQYFIDKDKDKYTKCYYDQILSKLNPKKVYEDLINNTLLCWEKSGDFCHRRLVAEWIENELGIYIPEY